MVIVDDKSDEDDDGEDSFVDDADELNDYDDEMDDIDDESLDALPDFDESSPKQLQSKAQFKEKAKVIDEEEDDDLPSDEREFLDEWENDVEVKSSKHLTARQRSKIAVSETNTDGAMTDDEDMITSSAKKRKHGGVSTHERELAKIEKVFHFVAHFKLIHCPW
jgi:hypothetical protein